MAHRPAPSPHAAAEGLADALAAGATLITANRRLAAHLRGLYDEVQHGRGAATWPSADILPAGAWLQRLWTEAAERLCEREGRAPAPLLPEAAQAVLWENIVTASPPGRRVLDPRGAAELALAAHTLRHQWRLPLERIAQHPGSAGDASGEAATFVRWSREAERWFREHDWADPAMLPERLADWVREGLLPVPERLIHAGFDELTPQLEALLDTLGRAGRAVEPWQAPGRAKLARRAAFAEPAAERDACARWARALLEAGEPGTIGIVVPRLEAQRGELERVFRDRLTPGWELREPGRREPYNLSLGTPLAEVPLVRAALQLLGPWHRPLPFETVADLLRSPYLAAGEQEWAARGRLDARLRERGALDWRWRDLAVLAGRETEGRGALAPRLADTLQAVEELAATLPRSAPPSAWAEHFAELLRAFGWPGERGLSSVEHQACEAWLELLAELGQLDAVLPRLDWGTAAARVAWLAGRRVFQPQRDPAPVQIVGVLEAGGLPFSHLWLLGCDDTAWPPAPQPNPFLPLGLQRELNLPHASAARELEYAARETVNLLDSAPDVVVSHPRREDDRELACSPLLTHLPEVPASDLPRSPAATAAETVRDGKVALESFRDGPPPALAEGTSWGGGVSLFSDQAACPFRAFAAHRLHARPLQSPGPGLSALERGNIVHKAQELLWERLRDHATLCALDEPALTAAAHEAADGAVRWFAESNPRPGPALFDLERERVAALLRDFLQVERERALPFTVRAREQRLDATFAGLTVRTRVDRIDRLADGREIIIDYKTGAAHRKSWFGSRPEEPQLPLYCASAAAEADAPALAGVAFARVSRAHMDFHALGGPEEVLPRALPFEQARDPDSGEPYGDRAALLAAWREALEGLARGFRAAPPRIDPRRPPGSSGSPCERCHLPLLCRLADWAGAEDKSEPAEDEPDG